MKTKTETETVEIKTKKGGRRPNVSVLVSSELAQPVTGFVSFLREHAIVGLAVGFAIGSQAQTVIKQFIASFIDPLSNLLFGSKLSTETSTVYFHGRTAAFGWGAMVYTIIDFLFILAAIYFVLKVFKLDKLDKPKA